MIQVNKETPPSSSLHNSNRKQYLQEKGVLNPP